MTWKFSHLSQKLELVLNSMCLVGKAIYVTNVIYWKYWASPSPLDRNGKSRGCTAPPPPRFGGKCQLWYRSCMTIIPLFPYDHSCDTTFLMKGRKMCDVSISPPPLSPLWTLFFFSGMPFAIPNQTHWRHPWERVTASQHPNLNFVHRWHFMDSHR